MDLLNQKPEVTEFPPGICFKYPWRKYQQRVLDDLQEHLGDDHLHVIAPPGSGKTVLGLEVALRLNKPTLILAPTIAIKNQWIQRFCELFLQTHKPPQWISKDIRNPKFFTVITYQGLHAACNDLRIEEEETEEEEGTTETKDLKSKNQKLDTIVNGLKAQHVKTIVVDEAHHLKNEWCHTLMKVKEALEPTMVGLTATPPYDVTGNEWQRYIDLNGAVDTEISVPELVLENDLCPHQDYVFFTLPTKKENENIREFRKNIERIFQRIKTDERLIKALKNHPAWIHPDENLDWIYNNLEKYSASLIFLHANKVEISELHLEVIGDKKFKIPALDYHWMEVVLNFYLYQGKEKLLFYPEHQKELENKLRRVGAIERRQIDFYHNRKVTSFITSSISKLNAIKEIVDFEFEKLGKDLRLVILSDYIRKEFFLYSSENKAELNKIGVIPIFEKLRRDNPEQKKIGVLTGSMVIIPISAFKTFEAKAAKYGISQIHSSPVPFDLDYVLIHASAQLRQEIVNIITQIFQSGQIEVLIGTKSLLGEGWDAPAINSLILATFVGSFVVSNQMRGRAIRKQMGKPEKTGNIWHLVCLDPTSETGGDDMDLLQRRFRSFVGISNNEHTGIENGTGRLGLPENLHQKDEIAKRNKETFAYAGDRESLKTRWKKALDKGVTLVEEIKIPFPRDKEYKATKTIYLEKTIINAIVTLALSYIGYFELILDNFGNAARQIRSMKDLYLFLTFLALGGAILFGRKTFKTFRLYLKYRDIAKDIHHIGDAILSSLKKEGTIPTDNSKIRVETSVDQKGAIYCHLEGGTTFQKSTFIIALQEVIGPVANPRYVIVRKSMFLNLLSQKDYHSVPEIFGRNKKLAENFREQWAREVGDCELIFTRTLEGRKLLLRSRVKSLASQFENEIEHVNVWK